MTDLTTGKEPRTTGQLKENLALTLASGQNVFQGLAAGILLSTGKVVNATGGQAGTVLYIGTFFADYDASSSGANADIPCLVKLHRPFSGVWMSNKTGDFGRYRGHRAAGVPRGQPHRLPFRRLEYRCRYVLGL